MNDRLLTACTAWLACTTLAFGQAYQVEPRPISLVRPGTTVQSAAPAGWTHLIVKSFPRVVSGDVDKIPDRDKQLASLLSTTLVARVQRGSDGLFEIGEVATGAGVPINGNDTIVDSQTQAQLGANLGFFARMVLKEFDAKQAQAQYKVISRHFLIVDTMGAFRWDNQNRLLPLRYAIVVEPQTGRLDNFCWLMDADAAGRSTSAVGQLQWLPPSLVFAPELFVDYKEYNFVGIPSDKAFCSTNIPPGKIAMTIPPDAIRLLGKSTLTAGDSQSLHGWFAQITNSMRQQYDAAVAGQPGYTQR